MPSPAELRDGVQLVAYYAAQEVRRLWPQLRTPSEIRDAMHDLLPTVNLTYGEAAAALAVEWYEADRVEAGARRRYAPSPVPVGSTPGTGGVDELAEWAAALAARPRADLGPVQELIIGGLQRRIANAARYTITDNAVRDGESRGWVRYTDGDACSFCRMLAGRGAVYSEQGVKFGAHDLCGCQAAPDWKSSERSRVDAYKISARRKIDSDGRPVPISSAERARVNRWIRQNIH